MIIIRENSFKDMLQLNIFLDEGSKCWLIINIPRLSKSQKNFLAITAGNLQLGKSLDVENEPSPAASPVGQSEGRPEPCDSHMKAGINKF